MGGLSLLEAQGPVWAWFEGKAKDNNQVWSSLFETPHVSSGTFPILSRDPSSQASIKNPGDTDPVFEKNDG